MDLLSNTHDEDIDLSITINERFARKFLDSIPFPWCAEYHFPIQNSQFSNHHSSENALDADEDLAFDDVLVEHLHAHIHSANEDAPKHSNSDLDSHSLNAGLKKRPKFKIDCYNIFVEVPQKPLLSFGNPIVLSDITVRLKMDFKASLTIYGKEYSTDQTTPWITLVGRSAKMVLSTDGCKIKGQLVLDQIDLKLPLKILQWEYVCRVSLTQILNKQLRKRGAFVLLDLAGVQTPALPNSRPLTIVRLDLGESQEYLTMNATVDNPLPLAD